MPSSKVTLFQKNINSEISKDQKQKLLSQKSDFLILPEYFPFLEPGDSIRNSISKSKENLDRILEISEYYKGVIIGGSIFREENGKIFNSCPIVQNVTLIDWYDKRIPGPNEKEIQNGDSSGIYIMNSIRFGILCGNESADEKILQNFSDEKIQVLFHLFADTDSSTKESYDKYLDHYLKLSKQYSFHILHVCGTGNIFGKNMEGRSLYASPSGINWKVGMSENNSEVIKTVSIVWNTAVFH
ncbi:MAG: amidohydrolase [Leptospira sp.]|nr:amidohydrolase [Leptospira sp.]